MNLYEVFFIRGDTHIVRASSFGDALTICHNKYQETVGYDLLKIVRVIK